MLHTLAFQIPSMGEWIVIAAIGLLFFGKRLPEVGKSVGQAIVQFKKGLKSIEEDVDDAADQPAVPTRPQTRVLPEHKFDPYTGQPLTPPAKFDPYTGKPLAEEGTTEEHASSAGSGTQENH